jgi:hypothetical protein
VDSQCTRKPDIDLSQFFINAGNGGCRFPAPTKRFWYPNTGKLCNGPPQRFFGLLSVLLPLFCIGLKVFIGKRFGIFYKALIYLVKW